MVDCGGEEIHGAEIALTALDAAAQEATVEETGCCR
jgi:hypothetical protein